MLAMTELQLILTITYLSLILAHPRLGMARLSGLDGLHQFWERGRELKTVFASEELVAAADSGSIGGYLKVAGILFGSQLAAMQIALEQKIALGAVESGSHRSVCARTKLHDSRRQE